MPISPIVFYDGYCGFCNKAIGYLLKLDKHNRLHFAPLQGTTGKSIIAAHPELAGIDSILFYEIDEQGTEHLAMKSGILQPLSKYLPKPARLILKLASLFPKMIADKVYDLIAINRYRFFPRSDACPIPLPEVRSRFIE